MRRTIFDEDHGAFRESCRTFVDRTLRPHQEKHIAIMSSVVRSGSSSASGAFWDSMCRSNTAVPPWTTCGSL
jgi:hypothetical protein